MRKSSCARRRAHTSTPISPTTEIRHNEYLEDAMVWEGFLIENFTVARNLLDLLKEMSVDPDLTPTVQQRQIALHLPRYLEVMEELEKLKSRVTQQT